MARSRCLWVGCPARAHPGCEFPSRLWAKLWEEEETCAGRETVPKWLLVASAPVLFSVLISLWFLDTQKCQGVLTKQKYFLGRDGLGEDGVGEIAGKELPWERAMPQSPDILGIMRD